MEYTIHYVEYGTNKVLHEPETYHGNDGDRPAVAYLYVEDYVPQEEVISDTIKRQAPPMTGRSTMSKKMDNKKNVNDNNFIPAANVTGALKRVPACWRMYLLSAACWEH